MNLLNSKYFGEFCAALVICALLLSQTGCAVVGPGGGQSAVQFAEAQAKEMNVYGNSFMREALGGEPCPQGTEGGTQGVRKDARISNNNGAVQYQILYDGDGKVKCIILPY